MFKRYFDRGISIHSLRWAFILILGGAAAAAHAADGSVVRGVVHFDGPRPELRRIEGMRDRTSTGGSSVKSQCEEIHKDDPLYYEDQIVSEKGEVANVFVYVDANFKDLDLPVPTEPAVLDQKGCAYFPHVQGVRIGQTLQIRNSDEFMHNVRSYSRRNRPFNLGQPTKGGVREKTFRRVEKSIKVKCDIHQWMQAYYFVMDHPFFAVTGHDGRFEIEGLPAGEYSVVAWHEVYGQKKLTVTVGEGEKTDADFTFSPKQ